MFNWLSNEDVMNLVIFWQLGLQSLIKYHTVIVVNGTFLCWLVHFAEDLVISNFMKSFPKGRRSIGWLTIWVRMSRFKLFLFFYYRISFRAFFINLFDRVYDLSWSFLEFKNTLNFLIRRVIIHNLPWSNVSFTIVVPLLIDLTKLFTSLHSPKIFCRYILTFCFSIS